jgi:hypothetical protein
MRLDGLRVRRARLGVAAMLAAAVAGAVLGPGESLAGPVWAQVTLDRYFRVDWEPPSDAPAPVIAGSVTNLGRGPAQRMQLAIERLDASGTVVGTSSVWVPGVIQASQRSYFTARVPAAAGYRVRIVAFDWVDCLN